MNNGITYEHKDLYEILTDKTTPNYDISIYDQQVFPIPPGVEMELVGISKEELAQLRERLKKTQELELEVRRENSKLKELLKECKEVLEMVAGETIDFPYTVDECIDKINQALGE